LLTRCGFAIAGVYGLHGGPRLAALDDAHGGSFAAAQLAAAPESWDAALAADIASVSADDFAVLSAAERDVDASLDLVMLARRS
jgi:hypothetical protein